MRGRGRAHQEALPVRGVERVGVRVGVGVLGRVARQEALPVRGTALAHAAARGFGSAVHAGAGAMMSADFAERIIRR